MSNPWIDAPPAGTDWEIEPFYIFPYVPWTEPDELMPFPGPPGPPEPDPGGGDEPGPATFTTRRRRRTRATP